MDSDLLPETMGYLPSKHRVMLDILCERTRQDAKWGGPAHDDTHPDGMLAIAGATYALQAVIDNIPPDGPSSKAEDTALDAAALLLPFSRCNHHSALTTRDRLIRGAACIVAEVERLDRAATQAQAAASPNPIIAGQIGDGYYDLTPATEGA